MKDSALKSTLLTKLLYDPSKNNEQLAYIIGCYWSRSFSSFYILSMGG